MRTEAARFATFRRLLSILYHKPNIPIVVIDAKDNNHSVGDGMQQALDYAETLSIPFAFSSNGDGFVSRWSGRTASPACLTG